MKEATILGYFSYAAKAKNPAEGGEVSSRAPSGSVTKRAKAGGKPAPTKVKQRKISKKKKIDPKQLTLRKFFPTNPAKGGEGSSRAPSGSVAKRAKAGGQLAPSKN